MRCRRHALWYVKETSSSTRSAPSATTQHAAGWPSRSRSREDSHEERDRVAQDTSHWAPQASRHRSGSLPTTFRSTCRNSCHWQSSFVDEKVE